MKKEIDFSDDIITRRYNEKNSLKRTVNILSFLCVISFVLNYILSITAQYLGFSDIPVFMLVSIGIITVFAVLMPFIIGGHFLGGIKQLIFTENKSKKNPADIILLIIFGFGSCITVNFLTAILSALFPGIYGTSSIHSYGNDIGTIILMIAVFALLPAICEEIAFRGIVIGSLEKYGDKVALVISSLLFALLHHSLSNMIFAFCSGIILGLVRRLAGSILPSMIVHFFNNVLGVAAAVLSDIIPTEDYMLFYYTTVIVLFLMALAALILLKKRKLETFDFSSADSVLSDKEKFGIALKGLMFIFAVFVLLILLF